MKGREGMVSSEIVKVIATLVFGHSSLIASNYTEENIDDF